MLNTKHTGTTHLNGTRPDCFRGPRSMAGEFASGLWMLLLGIFIGALFMAMFLGFRSGSDTRVGAGIRDVVNNRPTARMATNSPNPPLPSTNSQTQAPAPARQPTAQRAQVTKPRMSETIISNNPAPQPRSTVTFHEVLSEDSNVLPQPVVRQALPDTNTSVAPKPSTPEDRNIDLNTTARYSNEPMRSVTGSYYMLQVGSFQRYEEADRLKAELTMAGFTPTIQDATVRGTRVFRVRVGPYASYDDVGIVESRVRRLGHQPIQVKVSQN